MSHLILPASCYEEALPDLRAPYLATQIRPLIIQAPKNADWPCKIALYTIGETLMDRFNLCCGGNWNAVFTVDTHQELSKQGENNKPYTVHYFKVSCSVTVFGNEHTDFGEGESTSEALAEFDARAQAFKRASRWHGPGQCLYVFGGEEFIMWRGPEPGKLHVPKSGDEPHRRPYFDQAGRQVVRDEYAKWLKDEGESQFGIALNHLEIAEAIRERALHRPLTAVPDLSRALPDLSAEQPPSKDDGSERRDPQRAVSPPAEQQQIEPVAEMPEPTTAPAAAAAATAAAVPVRQDVHRLPMPDAPASREAVDIAESAGFTANVAHALSNLARTDAQEGNLSERQHKTVVNWLIVLSELHLTSEEIVQAVQFVGGNGTAQEQRQATFSRWLAGKASGLAEAPTQPTAASQPEAVVEPESASEDTAAATTGETATVETERALRRIHTTMADHGYSDRTVTLLARLSIGVSPKRKLDWDAVPAPTMTILADLLESAGAIGWSADLLGKEVLAAHSSKGQTTAARRFSVFAGRLMDLAEAHSAGEAA